MLGDHFNNVLGGKAFDPLTKFEAEHNCLLQGQDR